MKDISVGVVHLSGTDWAAKLVAEKKPGSSGLETPDFFCSRTLMTVFSF